MENNTKRVMLGDVIEGELVPSSVEGTQDSFCPTSKYIPVENTEEVYGKSALFLSELEKEVAVNVAEGIRYKALANMLDLDERVVKTIANRKHVRKFIQEYVAETTAVLKSKREMYLSQIIEARLDKVTDMANASELDTATLIAMLDSVQKEKEKAELQKTNTNQIVSVLQMITKD
jgi:hypothetical protein